MCPFQDRLALVVFVHIDHSRAVYSNGCIRFDLTPLQLFYFFDSLLICLTAKGKDVVRAILIYTPLRSGFACVFLSSICLSRLFARSLSHPTSTRLIDGLSSTQSSNYRLCFLSFFFLRERGLSYAMIFYSFPSIFVRHSFSLSLCPRVCTVCNTLVYSRTMSLVSRLMIITEFLLQMFVSSML